ncbi:MAG: HNH endonuclease signature motif containing protein [Pseudomonadota bacterium]
MSRPSSYKVRHDCYYAHVRYDAHGRAYLICHICQGPIWSGKDSWEAEHVVRRSVGGADDPSNVMPAHTKCHKAKTRDDVRENAKGKRVAERHAGIKRPRGFRRPEGKYNWATGRYERK